MSKRRKGYPSETHVKRGDRIVHGDKTSRKNWGAMICVPVALEGVFKNCCLKTGRFDGAVRNHYF